MSLKGTNNAEKIWNFFKDKGLTDAGIAGLMGNLRAESGLNPHNLQNSYEKSLGYTDDSYTSAVDSGTYINFIKDKAGYGLAQWTYWSRKQNMLNYHKSKKKSIGDLETQLEFLYKELSEGYKSVLKVLTSATTVLQASNAVLLDFEKPANQGESVQRLRASYGQEYYDMYKSKGGIAMSNSSLVSMTMLSPNHSGKRTHVIDRITPHCFVGQVTVKRGLEVFMPISKQASCQYVIGTEGDVGLCVDEANRAWTSSSSSNDNRAVTIECASDSAAPYAFNDKVYNKLIDLCVDICQRNGKKKLIWISDKTKALAYEPKSDEMQLTVHRWFKNKSCPGDWMFSRMGDLANKVTARLGGAPSETTTPVTPSENKNFPAVPFTVQVIVPDLNIRKEPKMGDQYLTGKTTGKGSFTIVEVTKDGWGLLKSYQSNRKGWIYLGNPKWVTIKGTAAGSNTPSQPESSKLPYMVRVTIPDLNIRTSPEYKSGNKTGQFTGKGSFTIVEERQGTIDSKGTIGTWGLLKSGQAGKNRWICLGVNGVTKV